METLPEYDVFVKATTFGEKAFICGAYTDQPLNWTLGYALTINDAIKDWQYRMERWLNFHDKFVAWPLPKILRDDEKKRWVTSFKWSAYDVKRSGYCYSGDYKRPCIHMRDSPCTCI